MAASLLVTAASALGFLEGAQAHALDLLLRLRAARPPASVVIIAVDERAFAHVRRVQPIPRDYLARVVEGARRAGAAAVAIDVSLATATGRRSDAALARALRAFATRGRVVLAAPPPPSGPLADPGLARAVTWATPRAPVDADGVIRWLAPVVDGRVAFGLAAAGAAGAAAPGALLRINFAGPARTFLTLPADAAAALADSAGAAGGGALAGRIALVGGTFEEGRDFYRTPQGLMSGVEVHANVTAMALQGRYLRRSGWMVGLAIELAVVGVVGLVLRRVGSLAGTLACAAGATALGVPAAYVAFNRGGYWIDFVLPVLATCVMGVGSDALARRRLRDSFARYVSPEVLAQVLADAPALRGQRRIVTVLFSDLRGFTALSERLLPERVAILLNEYFGAMTAAIFASGGMIDDFAGDAVMAVYGAPVDDPAHARHAVEGACAMQAALERLNAHWQKDGVPTLRMGIGIHTGVVFAGNVGGRDHLKYTMIGDAVNVASRVEELTKELDAAIVVTDETVRAAAPRVVAKDRGTVDIRGRVEQVRVWEVLGVEPPEPATGEDEG